MISSSAVTRWLDKRFPPADRRSVAWATSWFFCLLFGYYQLRPLREAKGFARGSDEIPMLFLASFVAMLVAVPIYSWVASKGGGLGLVQRVYRFFGVNLLIFFAIMQIDDEGLSVWVGRAFFVWLSVFNQFVVSMMWSLFAAAYRSGQAKRWFGLISAGGTVGGILGSKAAKTLSESMDVSYVLLVGVLFLELCLICGRGFANSQMENLAESSNRAGEPGGATQSDRGARPGQANRTAVAAKAKAHDAMAGVRAIAASPYLLGICGFLLAIKACATTVYCQQGDFIRAAGLDETSRFQLLADINSWVLGITLVVQLFGTAAVLRRVSMGWVLLVFPAIYVVGFGLLATYPTLSVVVGLVVVHRAASYAVIAPAIEVLYTVIDKSTLFRVKGILDTAVIRGGDVLAAQAYGGLRAISMTLPAIAWLFVPVGLVTCAAGMWVGRRQQTLTRRGKSEASTDDAAAS